MFDASGAAGAWNPYTTNAAVVRSAKNYAKEGARELLMPACPRKNVGKIDTAETVPRILYLSLPAGALKAKCAEISPQENDQLKGDEAGSCVKGHS